MSPSQQVDKTSGKPAGKHNPVLASLSALALLALYGLPFVRVAPNRLVSGQPVYFFSGVANANNPSSVLALVFFALLLALLGVAFFKPGRPWLWFVAAVAAALMPGLLWLAAHQASVYSQDALFAAVPLSRTSLGGAFWVVVVLLGLMVSTALRQLRATALQATGAGAGLLLLMGNLLVSGALDDLSIMKEYAVRADDFWPVVTRHLQLVCLALAATVAVGLPLGWAVYTRPALGRVVFPTLNIIQTIPSIALFGLLMAPLALLGASAPALGRAGISGVGLAPAVIALTLYGLLPIARGTLAGLQQVPPAMAQAARALGLTRFQTVLYIELPLALPVLLGGVRTAAVAAVGLAAVTALVGAGGLGSIVFEGLFSNAQDVVLLGVLPIIALGVVCDALFKALIGLARRRLHAHAGASPCE